MPRIRCARSQENSAVPRICQDRSLRRVAIYGRRWVCLKTAASRPPRTSRASFGRWGKRFREHLGVAAWDCSLSRRFRDAPDTETKHRWYAASEAALAKLEEVVARPEAMLTNRQTRVSRTMMDPASLRKAGDAGLNCELCNMPIGAALFLLVDRAHGAQ